MDLTLDKDSLGSREKGDANVEIVTTSIIYVKEVCQSILSSCGWGGPHYIFWKHSSGYTIVQNALTNLYM